jgi:hypothetical protein
MGYEVRMQADIMELLELFLGRVPDRDTHAWVMELTADRNMWKRAHHLFDRVRPRNLQAIAATDRRRECQYCFEEVCLQSLYNETYPSDPFDSCSPYWIIKNAIVLARAIGVPVQDVLAIVAPDG